MYEMWYHTYNTVLYMNYTSNSTKIPPRVLPDFFPVFQKIARPMCVARVAPSEFPNNGYIQSFFKLRNLRLICEMIFQTIWANE